MTAAPALASTNAAAAPIPRLAPVTVATLPARSVIKRVSLLVGSILNGNVDSEDRAEFALYRMDDTRLAPSIRVYPLAERCARVMRDALPALEATRGAPSQVVERSTAARISVMFEPRPPD
jgi:hypothetical protein